MADGNGTTGTDRMALAHEPVDLPRPSEGEILVQITGPSRVFGDVRRILGTFNPRAIGLRDRLLMRCDPDVSFGLAFLRFPIINLRWSIDSEDERIAVFCDSQIRPKYRNLAAGQSLALPMGWQVSEKVWENKNVAIRVPSTDGTEETVRFPNALTYHRFKAIHPSTLTLLVDDERDAFGGVQQNTIGISPERRTISQQDLQPSAGPERLVLWSFRKEDVWGQLTGFPMLDQSYEPWWWKTAMNLFANRYFERRAEPPYKARAHSSVRTKGGVEIDGFKFMQDMATTLKNGGAAVLPATRDKDGHFLFDLDFLQDDRRGDMFQGRLDYLSTQIMRSLWITDEALTSQGSGGRTRSEVHFETLTFALETILNEWIEVFQTQVIDPLVLYNFGEQALEESRTRVKTTGLTEGQRSLLRDIFFRVMDADTIEGGDRIINRLEVEKMSEQLGIPLGPELEEAQREARRAGAQPPTEEPEEEEEEVDPDAVAQQLQEEGVI